MSKRLEGKVILVTGSTTGIGAAMARIFSAEGATVMVHGRREDAARGVVDEIAAAGGTADFVLGDLADASVPAKLVGAVVERFGRIDGLVNNAAVVTHGPFEGVDTETFDRTVAINLRAPFFLIQAALPVFRKQGGGRVLNIGSINSYCGEGTLSVYSITKGGLVTLTRNIADACGREGVRVNLFNVGWVLTENEYERKKSHGMPDDWPDQVPKTYAPSGRLLTPEEIAWAGVYFLSEEAALINGATLDLEQYPLLGRNPVKED